MIVAVEDSRLDWSRQLLRDIARFRTVLTLRKVAFADKPTTLAIITYISLISDDS